MEEQKETEERVFSDRQYQVHFFSSFLFFLKKNNCFFFFFFSPGGCSNCSYNENEKEIEPQSFNF